MLNRICTIGHSTRALEEFVALLREHRITRLADIRRYAGSRRFPYFSGESLQRTLPKLGIEYVHFQSLGGRRRPQRHSPNGAWESEQFRGYADHMGTDEFRAAVEALLNPWSGGLQPAEEPSPQAEADRATCVMCAEAVPWRCHRNLLSDELVRRGVEVIHILGRGSWQPHTPNPMARFESDRVVYPPEQGTMFPNTRV